MFTKYQKSFTIRFALLLVLIVGMLGFISEKAGASSIDTVDASGLAPQVHISTPSYPVGISAKETKLVTYSLTETGNISGKFTSRSLQFYTQYGVPLSERMGPYPTSIPVNPLASTDWNELVYLPESVVSEARSMGEYALILKTTFSGSSTNGNTFNAEASLLLLLPPDSFGKVSPVDGGFASLDNLILKWNSSIGAIDYEYCFDTIDNNSCDTDWTGTYWLGTYDTFAKLQSLPSTTFYWQVRANNLAGMTYADNGKWWSFTTCGIPGATLITVENTNDSGPGSLRQAINDICQGGTITFDSSLSGQTITLASTLVTDKGLTIDGSAMDSRIRVSGNNNVGVLDTRSSNGVTLDSLLIKDGSDSGGITNLGVLTLVNCVISNNSSDYNGGGIANFGELTLINTTISGNTAASEGGGIYNDYYIDSVSSHSGKLTLTDSIIADNIADYGGGIYTRAEGEVITVINSNFSNNSAVFANGGGISNGGILEVLNSTFSSNTAEGDGGGIYNGSESTLTVIGSTFSENSVGSGNSIDGWGGAIFNSDYGVINITNSTFVKNVAGSGGAIFNYRNPFYTTTLTITNSTFSENSAITGGSLYNMGTLNLTNSILANSTTGNDCYHTDFNGGTIDININNLIETNASAPHSCGTALLTGDPNLGTLADNGGHTQTMSLLPGSPAIDAGDDSKCPTTDQRGMTRPQGKRCDIGAYEGIDHSVGSGTYDDADPAWSYSGTWQVYKGSGPYANTLHQSNTNGNFAQVTFNGVQVKLTYLKAPGRGSFDVFIDGNKVTTLSANSASVVWQATWSSGTLTAGVHTIRFQTVGTGVIDLDALQVFAPVGSGIYDDNTSAWSYSGTWSLFNGNGPYANTLHQSSTAGSYAEAIFDGAQVKLTYLKAPGRGSFDVYIDGNKVTTLTGNNASVVWQATWSSVLLSAGVHTVRFQALGTGVIDLDALQVLAPDTTVPAAISNLNAITGTGNGVVTLSWTAVGDDNSIGTVTSYLVRYATSAILTATDWNNATVVSTGIPTPKAAGQAESMNVSGLTAGQVYYFAVRALDEQTNLGTLSNSPSATASSVVPVGSGIYDDTNSAWSYSGTWSIFNGSGPYNNTLHQNNTIGNFAQITFNGTHFKLTYLKAPGRGSFDVFIDNSKVTTLNANSASVVWQATWTSATLTAGVHTIRFQALGAGVIDLDALQVFAPVTAGIYDDNISAWSYSGTWSLFNGSGPYANTLHQSSTAGSTAEVTFNGTQVKLTYLKAPGRGSFDVFIDNSKVTTLSANNASVVWQATWTSSILSVGVHTIHFQVLGTGVIDLDALQVLAPDTTAPAAISNLNATMGTGNGVVTLSWTAVGDDNSTGTATSYLVRYSTSAILTNTDWNNATVVSFGIPIPKAAGQAESMSVSGLTAGQVYYFAVRAQDEQTNLGALSNSPSATASSVVPVGSGIYDDNTSAWSYSGTWSLFNGSGPYANTLHQSSTAGSSGEVTFNGTQVKLTYLKAPGRGSFDVFLDNSKVTTLSGNSPTVVWQATWTSGTLTAGVHTVRFQALGNGVIDLDALQVVAPVTAGIYDDTNSAWSYSGTWSLFNGSGPYANTLHQSSAAGNYGEVTFNGTQITLTYLKAAGRGSFDVYIDGNKVTTLNANSASVVWQATWSSGTLTAGVHTVRFQALGNGVIDLDALQVVP